MYIIILVILRYLFFCLMWILFAKVILRYRSVFIWLILIATYFMIQQGQTVKLSYAMANLLPKNSKSQLDYDLFVEKFGIRDNVMVIGVKSKVIDNLSTFRSWCKLQEENIQNVRGVISAYSVVDAINLKKDKTENNLLFNRFLTTSKPKHATEYCSPTT